MKGDASTREKSLNENFLFIHHPAAMFGLYNASTMQLGGADMLVSATAFIKDEELLQNCVDAIRWVVKPLACALMVSCISGRQVLGTCLCNNILRAQRSSMDE